MLYFVRIICVNTHHPLEILILPIHTLPDDQYFPLKYLSSMFSQIYFKYMITSSCLLNIFKLSSQYLARGKIFIPYSLPERLLLHILCFFSLHKMLLTDYFSNFLSSHITILSSHIIINFFIFSRSTFLII